MFICEQYKKQIRKNQTQTMIGFNNQKGGKNGN